MSSTNTVQPQYLQSILQNCLGCLRTITVTPVWFANPVAYFGILIFLIYIKTDTANEKLFFTINDGEFNPFSLIEGLLVCPYPLFCDTIFMWMRYINVVEAISRLPMSL